ncbi:MAG: triose-phosphate isomerase [Parachlamydiaceae bacterium]|nr:triose-phosphate isomerase [Parachlamydiaceae bacterium]
MTFKKKMVVGNWKMNKTIAETQQFIAELSEAIKGNCHAIFLAVPFTDLVPAVASAKGTNFVIGAQNINEHPSGAYTGEISASMVKEAGAKFVILGHSERRQFFHETNSVIHAKIKQALAHKLQPIVCIGETLEQRKENETEAVLVEQIKSAFEGIPVNDFVEIIIAYEPVWAIGTGLVATIDVISSVHAFCRQQVAYLLGHEAGKRLKILYGGSVNDSNASQVLKNENVDGVLVGSASLTVESFSKTLSHSTQPLNTQPQNSCRCTS